MTQYLSVCSGIEAASVAWRPLGWRAKAVADVDSFANAVTAHHYPDVPNLGDLTKWHDWGRDVLADADILVGGTPCQAFSVAGLRGSLADDRGNLSLEFVRLADAIDDVRLAAGREPAIIVWENVPGVLSVRDNAFGCFLAGLSGEDTPFVPPRGKWTNAGVALGPARTVAWRVLDAQYFGLAQRRRRVFVVASARKGFDPAAVLLEWEGVRRDTPPRREARQVAPTIPSRSTAGGGLGTDFDCDGGVIRDWPADLAPTLNASFGDKQGLEDQHIRGGQDCLSPQLSMCLNAGAMGRRDAETETLIPTIGGVFDVAHTLKAEGFDASEDGTGRGTPLVPVTVGAIACNTGPNGHDAGNFACNQAVDAGHVVPVVYSIMTQNSGKDYKAREVEVARPIMASGPVGGNQGGDVVLQPVGIFQDSEFGVAQYDSAGTLRAGRIPEHQMVIQPIPFDTTQLTHPANRSNPQPRDPSHPLAAGAHPPAIAYAFQPRIARNGRGDMGDVVNALNAQSGETGKGDAAPCVAVAFGGDVARTLSARHDSSPCADRGMDVVAQRMAVRRLTPRECEALQGFPPDYTAIPWRGKSAADCPDGPRYKALGNSMAVPVMRWIGQRIAAALEAA